MEIYLHIGHPKSGSSFLQCNFFNKVNENFIGRPYSKDFSIIEKIIINSDEINYLKKKSFIISFFKNILTKHQKNIISIEDLTKPTIFQQKNIHNIFLSLKRFKEILSTFGTVKIIYVIRSHTDIICSYYEQYYLEDWYHHNINHQKILDFFIKKNYRSELNFLFDSFKYFENSTKLISIFGKNNLKILFYEDLKLDFNFFINEILKFMNINKEFQIDKKIINSSNEKKSYVQLIKRIINYIIKENIKVLFNLKKNTFLFFHKINEIRIRRKYFLRYKNDIQNIDMYIRTFYKDDCSNFENIGFRNKLDKYNYL